MMVSGYSRMCSFGCLGIISLVLMLTAPSCGSVQTRGDAAAAGYGAWCGTSGTTSATPITQVTPTPSPPTAVPQCKCGQQQIKRKKRSSEVPMWLSITKADKMVPNARYGNKTAIWGAPRRYTWNRNSNAGIRVVGGTDAKMHEFPWVVLITYVSRDASMCGGAIINNKYIITAAHCLLKLSPPFPQLDPRDIVVTLADHDISTDNETPETKVTKPKRIIVHPDFEGHTLFSDIGLVRLEFPETKVTKPKRIIVHPDFNGATLFNDIGLIELQEPLDLESTSNIGPACPPDPNDLYENREAVVVGWGFTKSPLAGPPSNADILQKAVLSIKSNSDCQAKYTLATEKVTDSMICALGTSNEDACVNDSGGPLVVKEGGSWVVVGLVSWGPSDGSCGGKDGKPGVYTRVGKYLPWIASNINGARTCPPVATRRNKFRNSFGRFK